jgi:hypothetical protein
VVVARCAAKFEDVSYFRCLGLKIGRVIRVMQIICVITVINRDAICACSVSLILYLLSPLKSYLFRFSSRTLYLITSGQTGGAATVGRSPRRPHALFGTSSKTQP